MRRLRAMPFVFLLVLLVAACGRPAERHAVMRGAETVKMTESEIRAGLAAGELGETTPIFRGERWMILREHPAGAGWIADARAERERRRASDVAAHRVVVVNAENPGEPIRLEDHLVPGKIVVFDFYSEYCPPCRAIAPRLERLAAARSDIVIRKIDINRPGHSGIDWRSPLVEQHGLESVPSFVVFDAGGRKMVEGSDARNLVWEWIAQAGA